MYAGQIFPKISTVSEEKLSVYLPGSTTPASALLVGTSNDGETKIYDERDGKRLIPGKYVLTLEVHCAELVIRKQVNFTVGVNPYELYWDAVSS